MNNQLVSIDHDRQLIVGAAADHAARSGVFADYQSRRAANTLRHQRADLAAFADYLAAVGFYPPAEMLEVRQERADALYSTALAWSGMTYGLVAGFVLWQLQQGYAIGTVNVRLSTVKQYAKLAFQAGALPSDQHALIRTVAGYQVQRTQARR